MPGRAGDRDLTAQAKKSMSTSRAPEPSRHATRRILLWVMGASAIVRLLYLTEHAASAYFNVAILDEAFYDAVARALLAGSGLEAVNPGFRPLLYPLFLAVFYGLGGESGPALAIAAQHGLGVLTVGLISWTAIRLFRRPAAGAVAGTLYLLAGPPLYFEGERLIATLFTFLVSLELALLAQALGREDETASWRVWALAGVVVGLAIEARPNAAVFLGVFPLLLLSAPRRARPGLVATALASAVFVHLAFVALTFQLSGRFELFPGSGGINFYLGNKPGADGMIPRQDRGVSHGETYRDSVEAFAEETYREVLRERGQEAPPELAAGEVSRYWRAHTVELIRQDPFRWLLLLGRKTGFLLWNHEIPNNKSYAFIRDQESAILRALPVAWWCLLSLAPLGVVLAWRRGRREILVALLGLLLLHAAGVVLFFVNSRYRLPLWPGMAILAAGGLLMLVETLRARRWRQLAWASGLVAALATLSLGPWLGAELPSASRDFFFRSIAHLERGELERAAADAERSLELELNDAAARFQLGNVALAQGELELALESYRLAASLEGDEPRIFNNLGIVLEKLDRPAEAYASYLHAASLGGGYAPAWVNAALLDLRVEQRIDDAAAKIAEAQRLGSDEVSLLVARALVAKLAGRAAEAEDLLAEARRRDAAVVEEILEQHRLRLRPEDLELQTSVE